MFGLQTPPSLPSDFQTDSMMNLDSLSQYMAAAWGLILIALFVLVIVYIYTSFAIKTIASKTGVPEEYQNLAWFPIANLYLMNSIAKLPWWLMFIYFPGYLISIVPIIGTFIWLVAISAWMTITWWKVCEARNKPNWWALLIVPVLPVAVGVVLMIIGSLGFNYILSILGLLMIVAFGITALVLEGIVAWKD